MGYDVINSLEYSTRGLWMGTADTAPMILTALAIVIVGWLVAGWLKRLVVGLFRKFNINDALDAAGVGELTKRAGYPLNAGLFVGTLVKWFVLSVFFVVALDVLRLHQVTSFVREVVLGYLPNVIVAVLILIAAVLIANAAKKAVVAFAAAGDIKHGALFGGFAYYAVMVFAALAVLNQLRIAEEMIQTLFMGMVFALSLALGLAFGLGGKDAAGRFIDQLTKKDHH